ncbi:MAG: hypothetical protein LBR16_08140, partial [Treponema sp.]|nr:hypothetical protein [Treponema sp.]
VNWGESGAALTSGITRIDFERGQTSKTLNIVVKRAPPSGETSNYDTAYRITVNLKKDPLLFRKITAFSFNAANNGLLFCGPADITCSDESDNSNATGTIDLEVFYHGEKPVTLYPKFETEENAGTVYVDDFAQESDRFSFQKDFSSPVVYTIVSEDGLWRRAYTVSVTFTEFSFAFSKAGAMTREPVVNTFDIDHAEGTMRFTLAYPDEFPEEKLPASLVPEINGAWDAVTVDSLPIPESGIAFTQTYDTPQTSTLSIGDAAYTLQVSFVRDPETQRKLTGFSLAADDINIISAATTSLTADGTYDTEHATGAVEVEVVYIGAKTWTPKFTFNGKRVTVDGTAQTSGSTEHDFTFTPKEGNPGVVTKVYRVESSSDPNYYRDYTVTVKMLEDPSTVQLTAFEFKAAQNPDLTSCDAIDVSTDDADITRNVLYAGTRIPNVPVFTLAVPGGKVYVADEEQTSGTSFHTFAQISETPRSHISTPVTYHVVSPDGTRTRDYKVTVNVAEDESSVSFKKFWLSFPVGDITSYTDPVLNPQSEINFEVLHSTTQPNTIYANYTPEIAGGSVKLGSQSGTAYATGTYSGDFTSDTVFTAVSPNGTIHKDYTVRVTFTPLVLSIVPADYLWYDIEIPESFYSNPMLPSEYAVLLQSWDHKRVIPNFDAIWNYIKNVPGVNKKTGLLGQYYNRPGAQPDLIYNDGTHDPFEGTPALERADPTIDFDWGGDSPEADVVQADYFAIRWQGFITVPEGQNIKLGVHADNGVRVYLGDETTDAPELVLDYWTNNVLDPFGTKTLKGGHTYQIRVEFCETWGGAAISLKCQYVSN